MIAAINVNDAIAYTGETCLRACVRILHGQGLLIHHYDNETIIATIPENLDISHVMVAENTDFLYITAPNADGAIFNSHYFSIIKTEKPLLDIIKHYGYATRIKPSSIRFVEL